MSLFRIWTLMIVGRILQGDKKGMPNYVEKKGSVELKMQQEKVISFKCDQNVLCSCTK